MKGFIYYDSPDFPNGIEYSNYADIKIQFFTNKVQNLGNNEKIYAISGFLRFYSCFTAIF